MNLILWMKYQSIYGMYNDIHKTNNHDINGRFIMTYREDSPWHTKNIHHGIHNKFTMSYREVLPWHQKQIHH